MRATLSFGLLLGLAGLFPVSAQTAAENDADLRRQVAALRDAVIQQTRQIDALTAEIERLGVALGQRRPSRAPAVVTNAPPPVPEDVSTPSAPTPTPLAVATPTPDPNIVQHTVVKGDNLTNIAKKYGTTIDAIQKLNKITDARKMQVGQIISVPLPTPAPTTSPTANP